MLVKSVSDDNVLGRLPLSWLAERKLQLTERGYSKDIAMQVDGKSNTMLE